MTKLTSPKAKFNPQYTNKRTKKCTAKRNIVVDNFLHIRVNNIIQSFYLLFLKLGSKNRFLNIWTYFASFNIYLYSSSVALYELLVNKLFNTCF